MQSRFFSIRTLVLGAAAVAATSAIAQEVQGQKGAAAAGVPKAVNVTQAQLNSAGGQTANWLHTNGDYAQTRYYPASQINTTNIGKLRPAFTFQTEVLESMETAPIVIDVLTRVGKQLILDDPQLGVRHLMVNKIVAKAG